MYGLLNVVAAASPREPRSTDLLLYLSIPIILPCGAHSKRPRFFWYDAGKRPALMFANGLCDVNNRGSDRHSTLADIWSQVLCCAEIRFWPFWLARQMSAFAGLNRLTNVEGEETYVYRRTADQSDGRTPAPVRTAGLQRHRHRLTSQSRRLQRRRNMGRGTAESPEGSYRTPRDETRGLGPGRWLHLAGLPA